ncbi:hypothetical protein D3C76_445600 [compost metagenome]
MRPGVRTLRRGVGADASGGHARNQPLDGGIPSGTSSNSLPSGRLFVCPGGENPCGSLEHMLREPSLRNQPLDVRGGEPGDGVRPGLQIRYLLQ